MVWYSCCNIVSGKELADYVHGVFHLLLGKIRMQRQAQYLGHQCLCVWQWRGALRQGSICRLLMDRCRVVPSGRDVARCKVFHQSVALLYTDDVKMIRMLAGRP